MAWSNNSMAPDMNIYLVLGCNCDDLKLGGEVHYRELMKTLNRNDDCEGREVEVL